MPKIGPTIKKDDMSKQILSKNKVLMSLLQGEE